MTANKTAGVTGALVIVVALIGLYVQLSIVPALGTHEPANKVSASGSTTEVFSPSADIVLLSERVKTSKPTDLILGVSAECSITTDVTTSGTDSEAAFGQVRLYVTIDGQPVPVSSASSPPASPSPSPFPTLTLTPEPSPTGPGAGPDGGVGRVVFCNRFYQRDTSLGADDQNDAIRTFMRTRTANAFNWLALDVGSGVHTIELHGELATAATTQGRALAAVGQRTMIVEPVKATNDEAVTQVG